MVDDNCLFCRIVSGEVPATMVYLDKNTVAFLDHRPLFHGHTLLVPREHIETLGDLSPALVEPLAIALFPARAVCARTSARLVLIGARRSIVVAFHR